ncbi:TPA: DMT family transporter [Morganella morganii]|uniref:DMT family transporter n=1 Tax=Morganella morganii TaxID=582 RepID=A0AAN5RYS6_MORMO|nr:DMT family transporter [Morganella morganii]
MDNAMTTVSRSTRGWINGFIGVLIFSGSLPATKAGITGFSPDFLTTARAAIAGIAALLILVILRQRLPAAKYLLSLIVVASGVVVGFPLLTALALQHVSSAHSIVYLGLLPLVTALFGVLRSNERPRPAFWLFSVFGSLFVMGFALFQGGESTLTGDLYMVAAVLLCGLGYAEGARLSRPLGSWQVICWALVLSLPLMLILSIVFLPVIFSGIPAQAWGGLIYVSLFSMLIGFFFWYRGLAEGGITGVSQLQLLQPFFGLVLSAWLLDETVSSVMITSTCGVIACVAGSKRFSR